MTMLKSTISMSDDPRCNNKNSPHTNSNSSHHVK